MDLFQSGYTNTGVVTVGGCKIFYGNAQGLPIVAMNVQFQCARRSQDIFPINQEDAGNKTKWKIYGEPSGSLTLQSVFLPATNTGKLEDFLKALGAGSTQTEGDCTATNIKLEPFSGKVCKISGQTVKTNENFKYIVFKGCTLEGFSGGIQGGDAAMFSTTISINFTGLEVN